MQSRTNTKKKREPLLNRVGDPVSKNTDKAEVMQKLNILFTGKVCSHVSYGLCAYNTHTGVLGRK